MVKFRCNNDHTNSRTLPYKQLVYYAQWPRCHIVIILQYNGRMILTAGDYVMIEPIAEGDKVKAEISHILYRPQVKFIQQQGLW